MASRESESTLREWFVKSALEAMKTREAGCWYYVLKDEDNIHPDETWALVIGWIPNDEYDEPASGIHPTWVLKPSPRTPSCGVISMLIGKSRSVRMVLWTTPRRASRACRRRSLNPSSTGCSA